MLDTLTRLTDKYFATLFVIPIDASLGYSSNFNVLIVRGSFLKNSWKVFGGLELDLYEATARYMASPVFVPLSNPIVSPSGNKTHTNDEIIDFVRDTCDQLKMLTLEEREEKISSFEKIARTCGWVRPNPSGFSPHSKSDFQKNFG